jgi:hypothetical protein
VAESGSPSRCIKADRSERSKHHVEVKCLRVICYFITVAINIYIDSRSFHMVMCSAFHSNSTGQNNPGKGIYEEIVKQEL